MALRWLQGLAKALRWLWGARSGLQAPCALGRGEVPSHLCQPDQPVEPGLRPRVVPQGRGVCAWNCYVSSPHLQAKCLCARSRKNGEAPGLAGHGGSESRLRGQVVARVQASRLGDSQDGPQRVGLAKQEGLGKVVRAKTPTREQSIDERDGQQDLGSLRGVSGEGDRLGAWPRAGLEPGGPGPSQTLRFRRRRGPGRGGRVWASGGGRGRLPSLLDKSGSSRELATCRDTLPKSSQL